MCFSPTVSFIAGAVLGVTGIATLKEAKHSRELPLASIPIMFAIQQFIEGLIWVVLQNGDSSIIHHWLTQTYVVFAGVIWPVLVPFSLLMIEHSKHRKKMLSFITLIGAGIAIYTLVGLSKTGVIAQIEKSHIVYHHPWENNPMLVTYIIATCAGFFCSSNIRIMYMGIINMAAFFVAYYFYNFYLASVWCLFAALMSGVIYVFFINEHKFRIKLKI